MTTQGNLKTQSRKYRVVLVDDHPLVRRGLAEVIAREPDMETCGEVADVLEAMREVERTSPDVVVVDLMLKTGRGVELIEKLKSCNPRIKILVSSMHDETLFAERVLRAMSANGSLPRHWCKLSGRVLRGELYVSPGMTNQLLQRVGGGTPAQEDPVQGLSNREIVVYQMIGQGLTIRQIATRLHLSPKTVETHREKIKQKLNLKSSTELNRHAVQWVLEHG